MTRSEEEAYVDECYEAMDTMADCNHKAHSAGKKVIIKLAKVLMKEHPHLGDFKMGGGHISFHNNGAVTNLVDVPGKIADVLRRLVKSYDSQHNFSWDKVCIKKDS